MRGDFARVTFDPLKHYTQVLQHQGRVNLEADWNEQGAIMLHLLRSLIVDLGGPAWRAGDGFTLRWDPGDKSLTISKGHFYVDGVLCENDENRTFSTQPFLPVPEGDPMPTQNQFGLVYLDAWERLITIVEAPDLREIAIGGPDTTSRAQVVWQVRALDAGAMTDRLKLVDAALGKRLEWAKQIKDDALAALLTTNRADLQALANTVANAPSFKVDDAEPMLRSSTRCGPMMRAKAKAADTQADLCTISPEARYRGLENQLYRIEVHDPGAGDGKAATFKWSRENGSVVFPIVEIDADGTKTSVTLAHLGRDARLGLCSGDWVEFVDDEIAIGRQAHPLAKVVAVDRGALTVLLDIAPPALNLGKHPLLRRWDQQERVTTTGVIPLTESGQNEDGWLPIEDGISVAFEPGGLYASGDYWVIPARVESGDIEWPSAAGDPSVKRWMPPRGVTHHLAALGILRKSTTNITDGALAIKPLAK